MTVPIPDSVREVIASGPLAHFTTLHRDGRPHTTVVWIGVDGDDLVIGKLFADQKTKNLSRDPRVSVSMEAPGDQMGMTNYVVIDGTAEVTPGGAPELLQELARTYVGPEATFPPMDDPPAGFVIRVRPDAIRGMGPWGTQMR